LSRRVLAHASRQAIPQLAAVVRPEKCVLRFSQVGGTIAIGGLAFASCADAPPDPVSVNWARAPLTEQTQYVDTGDPLPPSVLFELNTWGMPGATRFFVRLTLDDRLLAARAGPGLTNEVGEDVQLAHIASDALFQLAQRAGDFAEGCMTVGDGTSARLRIAHDGRTITRECQMAREWPMGADTKALLVALNSHLSKEMHIFSGLQ